LDIAAATATVTAPPITVTAAAIAGTIARFLYVTARACWRPTGKTCCAGACETTRPGQGPAYADVFVRLPRGISDRLDGD
jgi:hypothetical protein